jgi:GT2 family glycosyltransferase
MELRTIVVIPHYGPRHHLDRCLQGLADCRHIDSVQICVVHSGPDHLDIPITLDGIDILTIDSPDRLLAGAARNRGVAERSESDIILFIDADCVPGIDWISAHLEAHAEGAQLVTGPVLPGPPEAPAGFAEYLIEFAICRKPPVYGPMMSAPACNFSVRRDIFAALGGFPNNPAGQDLLFNLRCRRKGYELTFSHAAALFHSCRSTTEAFLNNRRKIGRGLGEITYQAEVEGLLSASANSEYRFLRIISRSPFGILLLPAKLFRLAVLVLRGDFAVLKYALRCPIALIRGLLVEGSACRTGYLEGRSRP